MRQNITLHAFTVQEPYAKRPTRRTGRSRRARRRRTPQDIHAGSVLAKIGLCAMAGLLVLALNVFGDPENGLSDSARAVLEAEMQTDETLGKLQFVELPGAISVFSPSKEKLSPPVEQETALVETGDSMTVWNSGANTEVMAAAAGEVRGVGSDASFGEYVRIAHADGLETVYYGFESIQVEVGQPVRAQDTLGTLTESGVLCLSVLESGRPVSAAAYFDL
ncbi:MAG: M23 family metallopeptidase, partial [Eubacteriales bacterium]|nr:M23 family metallopeptidase [Eubacteriales bacterium]